MVQVNESLTRQVAHLARLALSDDEITLFTTQLQEILGYVEQLQQVNVSGVDPLHHPFDLITPLREDEARLFPPDSEGKPKILKSANYTLEDGFRVPPIL